MIQSTNNENTKEPALHLNGEIEFNSRLTLSIAQKRIKICSEKIINEINLNEFVKHMIRLPAAPKATKIFKNSSKKSKLKMKNKWISQMSETQLKSWKRLNSKFQDEYFLTGRVILGKPQKKKKNRSLPIIEASPNKILSMFKKRKDTWDYNAVDWTIT